MRLCLFLAPLIVVGCNFPKPADDLPEPTEEEAKASFAADHQFGSAHATDEETSSDVSRDDSVPRECRQNLGTALSEMLGGAYQGFKGLPNNSAADDIDRRCQLALENKRLELMKRGLDLQADALRIETEKQQERMLLEQLRSLCDDGNAGACTAREFAVKKAGCCSWHHGARSCTPDHHVFCFDGSESPTCSC